MKVFIFCCARTGSNLLCRSLGQHPSIHSFSEKLKNAHQAEHVQTYIDNLCKKTQKPVSVFKVMRSYIERIENVLIPLIEQQQSPLIKLQRQSLLQQYISSVVAKKTRNYAGGRHNIQQPITLQIQEGPGNLADWVAKIVAYEQKLNQLFPNQPTVVYERLIRNWRNELNRIQDHFQVPIVSLPKKGSKQIVQQYHEFITNLNEAKQWLIENGYQGRI